MRYGLVAALIGSSVGPQAVAQAKTVEICASYQDQTIQPISIDTAFGSFKTTSIVKDEFETSAQFEERQKAALGGPVAPLIISKAVDPQYIKYNADTQEFVIQTYLFDNINMSYDVLSDVAPIKPGIIGNIDVVISETDTPTGAYEATNAFGAKANVIKLTRITKGIWERATDSITGDLFNTGSSGSTLLKINLSPDKARVIKPQLRIAFLVIPKPPYVLRGTGMVGRTTITRPIEITNQLTLLVADIQCAFLTDSANKVLGSFPVN